MSSGWHRKNPNDPASQARAREYRSPRYKQARAQVAKQVEQGTARCWRPTCRKVLIPGHWHMGHDDYDRTILRGGECASCNLKAAASKGAQVANAKRRTQRTRTSRTW